MQPTFHTGDFLLLDKRVYRHRDPGRGDIVAARYRGDTIVKRIIGFPGEEVEVEGGTLYVNGVLVAERYRRQAHPGRLDIRKGTLLPGKFALLGDNRDLPANQLLQGVVSKHDIIGRVVGFIAWPRPANSR